MTDPIDTIPPGFGLGAIASVDDPQDHDFPLSRFVGAAAPPKSARVPLPPFTPYDQGGTNQCVGYAGATSRTITDFPDAKRTTLFDAHELYCTTLTGGHGACDVQHGTDARSMLDLLLHRGAQVAGQPGTFRPIAGYSRLWTLDDIRTAIAVGLPVLVVLKWPSSWFHPFRTSPGSAWFLPKPGPIAGLHLTTLVAYNSAEFEILNTYGKRWADGTAWAESGDIQSLLVEAWVTHDLIEHPTPKPPPAPEEAVKPIVIDQANVLVLPPGTPLYSDLGQTVFVTVSTAEPRTFGFIAPGFRAVETLTGGKLLWLYAKDNVGTVAAKLPVPPVDCTAAVTKAKQEQFAADTAALAAAAPTP